MRAGIHHFLLHTSEHFFPDGLRFRAPRGLVKFSETAGAASFLLRLVFRRVTASAHVSVERWPVIPAELFRCGPSARGVAPACRQHSGPLRGHKRRMGGRFPEGLRGGSLLRLARAHAASVWSRKGSASLRADVPHWTAQAKRNRQGRSNERPCRTS